MQLTACVFAPLHVPFVDKRKVTLRTVFGIVAERQSVTGCDDEKNLMDGRINRAIALLTSMLPDTKRYIRIHYVVFS
jgi:hypothetical protein